MQVKDSSMTASSVYIVCTVDRQVMPVEQDIRNASLLVVLVMRIEMGNSQRGASLGCKFLEFRIGRFLEASTAALEFASASLQFASSLFT